MVTETHDSEGGTRYHVEVLYSYTWSGRSHQSTELCFGSLQAGDKSSAEDLCTTLTRQSDLQASVNPREPSEAVLLPGGSPADYIPIVFGVSFAGFAMLFITMTALGGASPTGAERFDQTRAADAKKVSP